MATADVIQKPENLDFVKTEDPGGGAELWVVSGVGWGGTGEIKLEI